MSTTSAEGRKAIMDEEGVRYEAYLYSKNVPTIGVGHTRQVKMGMKATPEQVDAWLQEDLAEAERAIDAYVHVPLNQNMYDALASLVFNIGAEQFRTSSLLRKLNEGLYKDASEQFLVWNKIRKGAKFEELKGLTKRREREKKMFLKPV